MKYASVLKRTTRAFFLAWELNKWWNDCSADWIQMTRSCLMNWEHRASCFSHSQIASPGFLAARWTFRDAQPTLDWEERLHTIFQIISRIVRVVCHWRARTTSGPKEERSPRVCRARPEMRDPGRRCEPAQEFAMARRNRWFQCDEVCSGAKMPPF